MTVDCLDGKEIVVQKSLSRKGNFDLLIISNYKLASVYLTIEQLKELEGVLHVLAQESESNANRTPTG